MNIEEQKAGNFVSRLLSNPTLQVFTALQREEQVLQFLQVNARQLYPTLCTPNFFPGKSWEQIFTLLVRVLFKITDRTFLPELRSEIADKTDLAFISFLRQQNWPADKVKEELDNFIETILINPLVRRDYTGVYGAIKYKVAEKYIEEVFRRSSSYVHFELTKVQRLKMSKEEIKHLVRVSLVLKPAIHVYTVQTGSSQATGVMTTQFAEKVFDDIKKKLPTIPDQVLKSAVNSNVSFQENRHIETTARISAIISSLCKTYRPNMTIDRGAVSPEKSWISVARKNYKYNGFDIKMLDEFYQIAAESGW
jgi:hypothetical protein